MEHAHMKSTEEVLEYFQVSVNDGLGAANVEKGREKFGLNGMIVEL